ncbi:hypothetical protein PWT90_10130 [Aphanocladium album]|nr:hypothetical protein PWT90_10130 [Aphanocladium album]
MRASQFRLVHLLPGDFPDNIQCILAKRPATLRCRYEALSYEWGDDTNQSWIQVAPFESPLRTASMQHNNATQLPSAHFARRLILILWMAIKWAAPGVIWFLLLFARVQPPRWIGISVSEPWYLALVTVLCGIPSEVYLMRPLRLLFAHIEARSCGLLRLSLDREDGIETEDDVDDMLASSTAFEQVQVTKNLALALRYLRYRHGVRTLWVDALCINQEDLQEREREILRMGWIYSNALSVIAWLGGYHVETEIDVCPCSSPAKISRQARPPTCWHQNIIQGAMRHISGRCGCRSWFRWFLRSSNPCSYTQSRAGLVDLAGRGWWKRLWVIQEAALATSSVQLQCGYDACEIADFWSAQYSLQLQYPEQDRLGDQLLACRRMCHTVGIFRFSAFSCRIIFPHLYAIRALHKLNLMHYMTENILFHEMNYWSKLVQMLFLTAGHFQCRDDQDRVAALLGIAAGHLSPLSVRVDSFLGYLEAMVPRIAAVKLLYESCQNGLISYNTKIVAFLYLLVEWQFAALVASDAWYPHVIQFNGPRYVMHADEENDKPLYQERGRVATLCRNARAIIANTGSLSILEAASCGCDEDEDMPSWIPNWSRSIGAEACSYLLRDTKSRERVAGVFEISDNSRQITVSGLTIGRIVEPVNWVKNDGTGVKQMSLQKEGANWVADSSFYEDCWLFLSGPLTPVLQSIRLRMTSRQRVGVTRPQVGEKDVHWSKPAPASHKLVWTYSYSQRRHQRGLLTAGEVKGGDQLVFIPDCFSSLVLRRLDDYKDDGYGGTWRLVGLVNVVGAEHRRESEENWSKLWQDKALTRYTIQ